jgi:hypothetical protein
MGSANGKPTTSLTARIPSVTRIQKLKPSTPTTMTMSLKSPAALMMSSIFAATSPVQSAQLQQRYVPRSPLPAVFLPTIYQDKTHNGKKLIPIVKVRGPFLDDQSHLVISRNLSLLPPSLWLSLCAFYCSFHLFLVDLRSLLGMVSRLTPMRFM